MERWLPLDEFEGYWISDEGRVLNERFSVQAQHKVETFIKIKLNQFGHAYVGMMKDGLQFKRGVALLVSENFIELPKLKMSTPTPIHVDGDLANCRATNLQWRPRWFAIKYSRQFRQNLGDAGPVRNINTGVVYQSIWDVVFEHGVLFNDVIKSIINVTWVFPLMQRFEWVEKD